MLNDFIQVGCFVAFELSLFPLFRCHEAVSTSASLHTPLGFFFCFLFRLSVCQILPKGVVSVIGPASSPASGSTVSHICGEKEVRWNDKTAHNCDNARMRASDGSRIVPVMNECRDLLFFFFPCPIKRTHIHFLTFIPSLPVCLCHYFCFLLLSSFLSFCSAHSRCDRSFLFTYFPPWIPEVGMNHKAVFLFLVKYLPSLAPDPSHKNRSRGDAPFAVPAFRLGHPVP